LKVIVPSITSNFPEFIWMSKYCSSEILEGFGNKENTCIKLKYGGTGLHECEAKRKFSNAQRRIQKKKQNNFLDEVESIKFMIPTEISVPQFNILSTTLQSVS
jgi:hypothetical protein